MATLPPSQRAPSPAGLSPPTAPSPLSHSAAAAAVAPPTARAVREATRRLQEAFAQVAPRAETSEEEEERSGELTFRGDGAAKAAHEVGTARCRDLGLHLAEC